MKRRLEQEDKSYLYFDDQGVLNFYDHPIASIDNYIIDIQGSKVFSNIAEYVNDGDTRINNIIEPYGINEFKNCNQETNKVIKPLNIEVYSNSINQIKSFGDNKLSVYIEVDISHHKKAYPVFRNPELITCEYTMEQLDCYDQIVSFNKIESLENKFQLQSIKTMDQFMNYRLDNCLIWDEHNLNKAYSLIHDSLYGLIEFNDPFTQHNDMDLYKLQMANKTTPELKQEVFEIKFSYHPEYPSFVTGKRLRVLDPNTQLGCHISNLTTRYDIANKNLLYLQSIGYSIITPFDKLLVKKVVNIIGPCGHQTAFGLALFEGSNFDESMLSCEPCLLLAQIKEKYQSIQVLNEARVVDLVNSRVGCVQNIILPFKCSKCSQTHTISIEDLLSNKIECQTPKVISSVQQEIKPFVLSKEIFNNESSIPSVFKVNGATLSIRCSAYLHDIQSELKQVCGCCIPGGRYYETKFRDGANLFISIFDRHRKYFIIISNVPKLLKSGIYLYYDFALMFKLHNGDIVEMDSNLEGEKTTIYFEVDERHTSMEYKGKTNDRIKESLAQPGEFLVRLPSDWFSSFRDPVQLVVSILKFTISLIKDYKEAPIPHVLILDDTKYLKLLDETTSHLDLSDFIMYDEKIKVRDAVDVTSSRIEKVKDYYIESNGLITDYQFANNNIIYDLDSSITPAPITVDIKEIDNILNYKLCNEQISFTHIKDTLFGFISVISLVQDRFKLLIINGVSEAAIKLIYNQSIIIHQTYLSKFTLVPIINILNNDVKDKEYIDMVEKVIFNSIKNNLSNNNEKLYQEIIFIIQYFNSKYSNLNSTFNNYL